MCCYSEQYSQASIPLPTAFTFDLADKNHRNELTSLVPSDVIDNIVSDPTQISAGALGLSDTQTATAILAYSKWGTTHIIHNSTLS